MQLALNVGMAVGTEYGQVVVGCDSRTSNEAVKYAFISGLLMAGAKGYDAGLIPTPTLAWAARGLDAGAMITASHNPPEYNGIKLVNPDGCAFDPYQQKQIEEMVSDDSLQSAPWSQIKHCSTYNGAVEQHIERIVKDFPDRLKLKVVLDTSCGAASLVTPYLLTRLGCEVIGLNCYPSGFFPHAVEPTEENFGELIKTTRELGADLGIAHDGDADRMMAVDDMGRFIPGDKLLVILARELGAKEVVTTVDASMVIEEMGFKVTRTRVGDTYVSEELRSGSDFGGEPSGSWVFPGVSLCPDGIYAAAQIASIASRQKLSALSDNIAHYPLMRGSISSQGITMSRLEQELMAMNPISVSNTDGIKLSFTNGWVLIRASGTEPKIRITAEARSEAELQHIYDSSLSLIKRCTGGE